MKALKLALPMLGASTLAVLLLWLTATTNANAAENPYTVCPAGPPQCSYSTIQAAVDAAPPGSVVRVAGGVYKDLQKRPRYGTPGDELVTQVLYITKSLTVRGGYAAPAFSEPPDPPANPTVLDARGRGRGAYLLGAAEPITVTIDGLQITGGVAARGEQLFGNGDFGGGLYAVSTTLTLQNSRIVSNTAATGGAGVYLHRSTATLQGNEIAGNGVTGMSAINCCSGGGVNSSESKLTLLNNLIAANTAELNGGVDHHNGGALIMANNVISANVGAEAAGGVGVITSPAAIRDNRFINNRGPFGALWLWFSPGGDEVAYNEFVGNEGGGVTIGPGRLPNRQGPTRLLGNYFARNGGTALSIEPEQSVRAVNNVFVGDPAGGQQAVSIDSAEADMLHTTVAGLAGYSGAGIRIRGSAGLGQGAAVTLTNSIIAGQSVGISVTAFATVTVAGILWYGNGLNTDSRGSYTETGAITGDPHFAADGYHLLPDSAAIDAGQDAGVTEDIDRFPRPYRQPDLGADEYWPRSALQWLYLPAVAHGAQ